MLFARLKRICDWIGCDFAGCLVRKMRSCWWQQRKPTPNGTVVSAESTDIGSLTAHRSSPEHNLFAPVELLQETEFFNGVGRKRTLGVMHLPLI